MALARKNELTEELAKRLVALRRSSRLFDAQVAQRCGISGGTLRYWLAKGVSERAPELYARFAQQYTDAAVEVEDESLDKVLAGESGKHGNDWKAHAWFLSRWRPQRWGERVPERGPAEAIDIEALVLESQERKRSLAELFADPPDELLAALRENREAVEAVLKDEEPPAIQPAALSEPEGG